LELSFTFDFETLEEVRRKLIVARETLVEKIDEFTRDIAGRAMHLARRKAPVLTGELRRGIIVEKEAPMRWTLKSIAPHAYALEFGVKRRRIGRGPRRGQIIEVRFPKKPYFFPAVKMVLHELPERVSALLSRLRHLWGM